MTPEEMMEAQKTRYPMLKVPYVLVFLADCILKYGGPTADGIFRISGSLTAMEGIKEHFNKGEYVPPRDVHDSSGLFKFILRSFPESLLPNSLYEEAINESPNSFDVFNKIPEPSRTVAGFVIRYIRENYLSEECVKATQMGADNIATVFFPCFIKNPSTDLQEVMKHMDQERMWVKKCLLHLDVTPYPSLAECIAASAPAPVSISAPPTPTTPTAVMNNKPSEEAAATQRAKALPMKPLPNPKSHPPQESAEKTAEPASSGPAAPVPVTTKPLPTPRSQPSKEPSEPAEKPTEEPSSTAETKPEKNPAEEPKKEEEKPTPAEEPKKEEEKPTPAEEEKAAAQEETKEPEASPAAETKSEEEGGAFDGAATAPDTA